MNDIKKKKDNLDQESQMLNSFRLLNKYSKKLIYKRRKTLKENKLRIRNIDNDFKTSEKFFYWLETEFVNEFNMNINVINDLSSSATEKVITIFKLANITKEMKRLETYHEST